MRTAVLGCVVAVLLVCSACRADPPGEPAPSPTPDVALDAESERLQGELGELPGVDAVDVRLRSGATFGRQVLIEASAAQSEQGSDVLDELTRAGWHTLAFVPTEVRVVLAADGETLTPRDLGFPRHGADSAGLYDRYGPPAADEGWRP